MSEYEEILKKVYIKPHVVNKELSLRRKDLVLKEKITDFFKEDFPPFMKKPHLLMGRSIFSANGDSRKLISMSKKCDLPFMALEYSKDYCSRSNDEKRGLIELPIKGRKTKLKLIDSRHADGKKFDELYVVDKKLIDIHHHLLYTVHPEFKDNIYDMSDWVATHGSHPKIFYSNVFAHCVLNGVLLEDFLLTGQEAKFTKNIIIPAIQKTFEHFGYYPLVVKLLSTKEESDNSWWKYPAKTESLIEKYLS